MLALHVDFNEREMLPDGNQAAAVSFGIQKNPLALEQKMEIGLRVILYDFDDRYEGVLRHGERFTWVADLIPGTYRALKAGEFELLSAATVRAAEEME